MIHPQTNIRVRTRIKGSVNRPTVQQNSNKSQKTTGGTIRRRPVRRRNPNKTILTTAATPDGQQQGDVTTSPAKTKLEDQMQPRTRGRTRTRTRISSASLPNSVKGEQSAGRERSRVRGRVNIRQGETDVAIEA